jgi:hypothetical protein
MGIQVRKRLFAGFGEVNGCHRSRGYCAFCLGGLVVSYGELMNNVAGGMLSASRHRNCPSSIQ